MCTGTPKMYNDLNYKIHDDWNIKCVVYIFLPMAIC